MINKNIIKKVKSIVNPELPYITNLANLAILLYDEFNNSGWAGFYLVFDEYEKDILYLGPYHGPLACTKIKFGKGVCGTSAKTLKSLIVADVTKFESYIACFNSTKSEIVVPIIKNNKCIGVIDLDSDVLDNYSNDDLDTLEEIADIVSKFHQ